MACWDPATLGLCFFLAVVVGFAAWYAVRGPHGKMYSPSASPFSTRPLAGAEFSYHLMECKIPGASKVVTQCRFNVQGDGVANLPAERIKVAVDSACQDAVHRHELLRCVVVTGAHAANNNDDHSAEIHSAQLRVMPPDHPDVAVSAIDLHTEMSAYSSKISSKGFDMGGSDTVDEYEDAWRHVSCALATREVNTYCDRKSSPSGTFIPLFKMYFHAHTVGNTMTVGFLLVAHHLICDGVSLSTLVGEIMRAFEGHLHQVPISKPAVIQGCGFSRNLKTMAEEEVPGTLQRIAAAGSALLTEIQRPKHICLPIMYTHGTSTPNPTTNQTAAVHTRLSFVSIEPHVMAQLQVFSRKIGVTINAILNAAVVYACQKVAAELPKPSADLPILVRSNLSLRRFTRGAELKELGYFVGNLASYHKSSSTGSMYTTLHSLAVEAHNQVQATVKSSQAEKFGWALAKEYFVWILAKASLSSLDKFQSDPASFAGPASALTSNIGVVDAALAAINSSFTVTPLEFSFCSSANTWKTIELTAATWANRCTLCFTYPCMGAYDPSAELTPPDTVFQNHVIEALNFIARESTSSTLTNH